MNFNVAASFCQKRTSCLCGGVLKTTKKTLFGLGTLMLALVCCLDTASAQTLTASPASLTFTTPAGVVPPSQSFTIMSSAATTVNLTGFPGWIQFSPTNGATPLMVTVSIAPGAPVNSSNGSITVTPASGTAINVPINLNISGTAGVLTTNQSQLNFSFTPGSQVPSTQPLTIGTSNSGVTTFQLSSTTSDLGPWLTIADPGNGVLSGSPPSDTIMVTVSPSKLPSSPGPFSGTITLTPPGGGQATTVAVNVTITTTPALTVTPSSLAFAYQFQTSPPPAAQTLTIGTSTGAAVPFSATTKLGTGCGNGWLIVSQQNSTTPGTISVSVNTAGLGITTCSGEVDITATGVSNSPVVIPVSLLISASPLLQVPTPGPTFTYQFNTGIVPQPQNVTITASSNAIVNFSAIVSAANNGPNFLQVTPVSGTTPQALTLTLIPLIVQSLGPGTYVENVQLSSTGAGNSPIFPVTLVVSNTAALTSSAPALTFNYQVGQTPPQTQTLTINSTAGPLNFTVAPTDISANCPGFLSATVNGGATGLTFGGQNQVAVGVNVTGLTTNQTCTGNLAFTVPGSTFTFKVGVTLNVSTSPLLSIGVPSINVTALANSAGTLQQVALTSSGAQVSFFAAVTTNPMGLTWISVAPNSGTTPSSLQVSITPGTLAVGTYTGTIIVSSPTSSFPVQTIQVTLTIVSSNISTTPTALSFAQPFGSAAPPSQTLQVSGVPSGTTVGAVTTLLNGTGWLAATVSGNTVTVTANGSTLSQGTYNGVVTVIVPGAGNSPLNVPVTLVVGSAQSLSLSATTVNFSYQIGAAVPAAQTVQLSSTGAAVPFTATFVAGTNTPANLVTITPASGMTPSPLALSLNAAVLATLPVGTYSGNVVVSSTAIPGGDQTIKVNLTVVAAAAPLIASVVNGASFAPGPVSPGEIISLFGSNMGPIPGVGFVPVNGKIDVTLAGTQVLFDNVPAPVIFVSNGQINAIVPYEVASLVGTGQGTKVTVVRNGVASNQVVVGLTTTSPAIFSSLQTGNGQGAILNQNLSANSVSNPAVKGSFISIYATGEGSLTPFVPNGTIMPGVLPLPKPIATPVTVTIGGQPAMVSYAGEAPDLVAGVLQVNAMVPTTVGSGPQQVVLTIGTNSNNTQVINVAVQ
jgi:uncharacterized protein (TIGR03437 family)